MPNVTLHLGDCLDYMRGMEATSVDCIVADPPYGIGVDYGGYVDNRENLERLVSKFVPEARRVAKRVLITCGVSNIYLYPQPNWILSWHTPAGAGSSSWGFCCWQPILAYGTDPFLAGGLGRRPDSVVWTEQSKPNGHPVPKPENFMKWLILRGSVEKGDTIFDPFMGSGTTGVAAVNLGRNFIGCEINPDYYAIAERRIREAQLQIPLDMQVAA
jgi:site-specific DNA-methyltransferase (adenine-specific)